jgi:23S rRNA pseudouridine2605 synthase
METLLRYIVEATGLSRRRAFAAIREGRVRVAAAVVLDPSRPYASGEVTLDGRVLRLSGAAKTYLLLNKPAGLVSSRADERGRATVFDLVPPVLAAPGLHSVGRLDRDTSGLLLLTDDGDLTFRLTHPRHRVEKEYWVGLAGEPDEAMLAALARGVNLDGALRRPVSLARLAGAGPYHLTLAIGEGRNRQVRRMLEAVGGRVTRLKRVREGPLRLGDLPEGAVRRLSGEEVASLFKG